MNIGVKTSLTRGEKDEKIHIYDKFEIKKITIIASGEPSSRSCEKLDRDEKLKLTHDISYTYSKIFWPNFLL